MDAKNMLFMFVALSIIISCNYSENKKDNNEQIKDKNQVNDSTRIKTKNPKLDKLFDYRNKMSSHTSFWEGGLQGITTYKRESLLFYEVYDIDSTFRMVILPKLSHNERLKMNIDSLSDIMISNLFKNRYYNDYIFFVFYYPIMNPDSMDNYHAPNVILPCEVRSYMVEGANWNFIGKDSATQWQDVHQIIYDKIYTYHD